jgi:hypothetical protein
MLLLVFFRFVFSGWLSSMLFWAQSSLVGVWVLCVALFLEQLTTLRQQWIFRRELPVEYAVDPNRTPAELLALATQYPEVVDNPALPLLSLENPQYLESLFEAVERGFREKEGVILELETSMHTAMRVGMVIPGFVVIVVLFLWWYL